MGWWRGRQRAGEHSTQIQAQTVVVLDSDQAREIFDLQQAQNLARAYTDEARETAEARTSELGDRVVETLSREDLLQVFAEPDFQALLAKAQIGAAQTDNETDYDVLSSMLADRARKGNVRKRRIGLDRAIEVVDKVDLPALKALTVLFLVDNIVPSSPLIAMGLQSHDEIYASVVGPEFDLPTGRSFVDHLDLLNLVRANPIGGYNAFVEFFSGRVPGWLATGVAKTDPSLEDIWQGFARRGLQPILAEHELNPEFFRLGYSHPATFRQALEANSQLSPLQVEKTLKYAADWFHLNEQGDPLLRPRLMELVDETSTLGKVKDWLSGLPNSVFFTEAGTIMARAYAESCGVSARINGWSEMDI